MPYLAVLVVAALCFFVFFLIDKGFTKLFRSQSQHHSGTAVRLHKRYATIGVLLVVFGAACVITGIGEKLILLICGIVMLLTAVFLLVYYMTFGVFYDADGFVLTTFGKKSTTYQYKEIVGQKLYKSAGNVTLVEIYLTDGRTFQLQSNMAGAFEFLDQAFLRWVEQTGKTREECTFHDKDNCCWFPPVEEM
ncbi:MAG: hypothetical protein IJZ48_00705 [Oscillospiraceae bacterium]|nr:hypothetical protein [Oscillospiraceae bacterium]